MAIDFSVTHPLQLSLNLAEVRPGKQAKTVELRKSLTEASLCNKVGWEFCPFVVETFGAWGGQARHFVQRLVKRRALVLETGMGESAREVTGRIAAALFRSIARQLERGFPAEEVLETRAGGYSF